MLRKIIKYFILPSLFFVIFLGLVFYFLLKSDLSFSTLSYFYDKKIFRNNFKNPLKKGEKIIGEFQAKENNLGIIAIAFDPYYKTWDDVIFRIKEKNKKDWYFQNKYWANQFVDFEYFSFGFPIIENSKGKTYVFEIESLVANYEEGLGVRQRFPSVVIKYKFEKSELINNKIKLLSFLFKKFLNNLQVPDFLFITLISFLPFLFYLLNFFYKNSNFYKLILFLGLFIDLFFIRNLYIFVLGVLLIISFFIFSIYDLLILIFLLIFLNPLVNLLGYSFLQFKILLYFYTLLVLFLIKYFIKRFKR